jgi:hypothetical protein
MRVLEVFKGTGSVGKVFEDAGCEVISVDLEARFNPTHLANVLEWDYTQYPPGHFDYAHFSPPCTEYSRAMTGRPRRLDEADLLVNRVLEMLVYFRPRWWTIENPYTGLLKTRPIMQFLRPFLKRCCYCIYSEGDETWCYRKETAIWTNIQWTPRPVCCKSAPCMWLDGGRHPLHAQGGGSRFRGDHQFHGPRTLTRERLYSMPPALITEWLECIRGEMESQING